MTKLFLPDDVLAIIRDFSRPLGTRLDWRKCKRNEAWRIKSSNKALCLWYKWFIGNTLLNDEIQSWTFYGRRHLIRVSKLRFWTMGHTDNFYETRFIFFHETPRMVANGAPCEYYMADVSLIV